MQGILTNWSLEKVIWDKAFATYDFADSIRDSRLVLTETLYNLPMVQDNTDEIMFEEYRVGDYWRATTPAVVSYGTEQLPLPPYIMVLDLGFSFSSCAPVFEHEVDYASARRIIVGGKLLTNHLKETVSFRYYNMMDETYLLNEIKEDISYIARDFNDELERFHRLRNNPKAGVLRYLLPDYNTIRRGRIVEPGADDTTEHDQVLSLRNERFTTPELLFHPKNIGIDQGGIHEMLAESISSAPPDIRPLLWANIVVCGGSARIPGLLDRLRAELRPLAPDDCDIGVHLPQAPDTLAARCGIHDTPAMAEQFISRRDYDEYGPGICLRKWGRHF